HPLPLPLHDALPIYSLHGAVAQKLLRKLCTNCRVPYQPTPEMLKKLGLPEGKVKQLFKKSGQVMIKNKPEICPACRGTGYFGQEDRKSTRLNSSHVK